MFKSHLPYSIVLETEDGKIKHEPRIKLMVRPYCRYHSLTHIHPLVLGVSLFLLVTTHLWRLCGQRDVVTVGRLCYCPPFEGEHHLFSRCISTTSCDTDYSITISNGSVCFAELSPPSNQHTSVFHTARVLCQYQVCH